MEETHMSVVAALEDADDDLHAYAEKIGLDVERFERDRLGPEARARIGRDVASGDASGEVNGTPLLEALAR